jgi:hypothetical protein
MLTMVDKGRQRFGSKSLDLRIVSVLAGLLKKFDVLAVVINAHFPDELLVEMLGLGDLGPRWPGQIPPPLATPNSPRQDRSDYDDSGVMAMRAAASLRR